MNSRLYPKTCTVCGASFIGGTTAQYCPDCRAERIRERERKRTQAQRGKARKIGSADICVLCGKQYAVNSGMQKYCPECSAKETKRRASESHRRIYAGDPQKRQLVLDRAREWALENPDRAAAINRASYERNKDRRIERRRAAYGVKLRPLGRVETCPKCNKRFIVRDRNQKYCSRCSPKACQICGKPVSPSRRQSRCNRR